MECLDTVLGLKFRQVFWDNIHVKEKTNVVKCSKSETKWIDYTTITSRRDLTRFRIQHVDKDTIFLLFKRAYNIAGFMSS